MAAPAAGGVPLGLPHARAAARTLVFGGAAEEWCARAALALALGGACGGGACWGTTHRWNSACKAERQQTTTPPLLRPSPPPPAPGPCGGGGGPAAPRYSLHDVWARAVDAMSLSKAQAGGG